MTDRDHMRAALGLARRHLGETWPNPSVGCVIVSDAGSVVGRGTTAIGGRPHAEAVALAMAGERARGGVAYVSLEPCAHEGMTPPCVDQLIAAGIGRVVASVGDPDERVDGRGFERLRQAGIVVQTDVLAVEGAALVAGFVSRVTRGRPLVTLKLAATLDGRIATGAGESRWITGPMARRETHRLRAEHDAILVGIGTALADDPMLDCRLAGARTRPPVRVVLDGSLRLGPGSRLVRSAREAPVWALHRPDAAANRRDRLDALGVVCVAVEGGIEAALVGLGGRGLTSVLAEGGAAVAASLLDAGLADRIAWFTAPFAIGADGVGAVGRLAASPLDAIGRFERLQTVGLDADIVQSLRRLG